MNKTILFLKTMLVRMAGSRSCPIHSVKVWHKHFKSLKMDNKYATLDNFLSNPGLQHLAKEIFLNINSVNSLQACQEINQFSKQIFENPLFWLKKFVQRGLSKKNQEDWMKVIQSAKNSDKEKHLLLFFKWTFQTKRMVDLPCYTSPIVQDDFQKKIYMAAKEGNIEIVKILAPLTDNPNAAPVWNDGQTPIYWAAVRGHTEIVKILAPLTDNPNSSSDYYGETPINWAACKGHIEIVKILAPLTDNPNAAEKNGRTPIYWAAKNGHTEIVRILAPLTDNPNTPDNSGKTPIYWAAYKGHTEIIKILAPMTDNPNVPSNSGENPIDVAKSEEIRRILLSFKPSPSVIMRIMNKIQNIRDNI